MIDYRNALIKLMQAKAEILNKNGCNGELYFNDADVKDFDKMSDVQAKYVWTNLNGVIYDGTESAGLSIFFCPWCIYVRQVLLKGCAKEFCPYGRKHQLCSEHESDFFKLTEMARRDGKKAHWEIFTKEVYKNIVAAVTKELGLNKL